MKKFLILILVFLFLPGVLQMEQASAKKILIGKNKGKEILGELEIHERGYANTIEAVNEVAKTQAKTNELLGQLLKDNQEQRKILMDLGKVVFDQQKVMKQVIAEGKKTKAEDSGFDFTGLESLQEKTNILLKELIDEQKWLAAILQGIAKEEATVGKRRP